MFFTITAWEDDNEFKGCGKGHTLF